MPEEIEVPLDDVQDKIHELHHEREQHGSQSEGKAAGWTRYAAVTTAILAVIAAIGALQSGLLINEALIEKNEQVSKLTEASDQWNYYQAEGLKSLIYRTTAQTLPPMSPSAVDDLRQAEKYKAKQEDLKKAAEKLVEESHGASHNSEKLMERHHIFALSVSLCQIAIALAAIAALTVRRPIWIVGLISGLIGLGLLLYGFVPH